MNHYKTRDAERRLATLVIRPMNLAGPGWRRGHTGGPPENPAR